ncbi:MAG: UvrD-helicase domain-containing protein [Verrucomicrobiota bacterium]
MQASREKAAFEFARSIAVDASAGTGKTATLVARVTNLFLDRPALLPDEVLLLTFTDKAAAEMKARVTEGWERLYAAAQEHADVAGVERSITAWNPLLRIPGGRYGESATLRRRVEEMVDAAGRLSVTTFHSFCTRILRSFPAEAGVDPLFPVLAEGEAADAWEAGFRQFLREEFGRAEVSAEWERILLRSPDPERVWGVLRRLCLTQRDLLTGGPPDFGAPDDFLGFLRKAFLPDVAYYRAFVAGIAAPPDDPMSAAFRRGLEILEGAWKAVADGDLDVASSLAASGAAAMELDLRKSQSKKRFPRPEGPPLSEVRDHLRKFFELLGEVPGGDAAARFLYGRAETALACYERAKGSGLDFMDLLLRAESLLVRDPAVVRRLSDRFRHIFVDEFQDTDPLQAEVLRALSAGGPPGKLFVVGDPKQSIYGFRRADIQVYQKFRREMIDIGGEGVSLSRNFRSRPDLLGALNGLFAAVLPGGEDFSPAYAGVEPHRADPGEGAPVTLYELGADVDEAEFLAALIRKIAGNVKVRGRGGDEAPARLRDIAVLYRSDASGEVLSGYRKALSAAGIPHIVPSRKGFFLRQEVQDLRMVLSAVDVPADRSARHAALKTIFFGLSDDEIVPLHGDAGPVPPRAADAVALLSRLAARKERAALPDLIAELYRETGVEFVAARLPEGERVLQNLSKAAEMARSFEWEGRGSLKLFLAEIRRKTAEGREEDEVPDFEEDEDAVRLSTIHAAKGLEFPVVILGALSRGGRKGPQGLRVDRVLGRSALIFPGFRTYSAFREVASAGRPVTFEEWERRKVAAEERRLLYVAATRAKDRLYLVDGKRGMGSDVRDALRAGIAAGTPAGESACLLTGLAGERLRLGGGAGDGARGGELLRGPVPTPFREEAPGPETAALPPVPEARAADPAPPLPEGGPVALAELYDRFRGRRFGEKVHRVLEAFPPVTSPWPPAGARLPVSWEEGEEHRWERIEGAVRASRLYGALRSARLLGTELPLLAFRAGRVTEDRADLVVRPEGEAALLVVDYKTGPREAEMEAEYRRKLREYCGIVSEAWGVPARGVLWYVETGEEVEVS